jgi:hypothetical protein
MVLAASASWAVGKNAAEKMSSKTKLDLKAEQICPVPNRYRT